MSATRYFWRVLLTVVQIATLVAVPAAGAGHAHAGACHVGHPAAVVGYQDPLSSDWLGGLSEHAERSGDDASDARCGMNCCCQASLRRWESLTVPVSWILERTLAGIREVAFDSISPETLPEPPRTIA